MKPIFDRRAFLTASAASAGARLLRPDEAVSRELGAGRSTYGERAKYETSQRLVAAGSLPGTGSSRTPLQDLQGIITPSALHFERHHSGVPDIDPADHELMVHGLVDKPLIFSISDLYRLPAVSRIHFLECAGNSSREHEGNFGETAQESHGLLSCSEWSGVPLRVLLESVSVKPAARWIIAEGADASRLNRSLPLEKALDDVIVAYAQNGEALRPSQGYPLRLLVPGWEGNISIKWLGRLEVTSEPHMTRDESVFYTDLLPSGKAQRFAFVMEAKSVITRPSGSHRLAGAGAYEIRGLAWSGRGCVARVEVSTDEGRSWQDASLASPILPKSATRFCLPWRWNGEETTLQSRCTDETGYVQPTRETLLNARGKSFWAHHNGIKVWYVHKDGTIRAT